MNDVEMCLGCAINAPDSPTHTCRKTGFPPVPVTRGYAAEWMNARNGDEREALRELMWSDFDELNARARA